MTSVHGAGGVSRLAQVTVHPAELGIPQSSASRTRCRHWGHLGSHAQRLVVPLGEGGRVARTRALGVTPLVCPGRQVDFNSLVPPTPGPRRVGQLGPHVCLVSVYVADGTKGTDSQGGGWGRKRKEKVEGKKETHQKEEQEKRGTQRKRANGWNGFTNHGTFVG